MMIQRSCVWPGCVRKLKFVVSGLLAGKLRTVQFVSTWIWSGGGTTSPSIMPKYGGSEQLTASAGKTGPSSSTNASSCSQGRLPLFFTSVVSPRFIVALSPLACARFTEGAVATPVRGLDSGGPAVVGPVGPLDR